jgi:DNA-binding MarR family transcriptional regulator
MDTDAEGVADELQFVVGALVRQMRSVSPAHDIPLSQVSVLKRLDREGPRTIADLARLDKITHQSVAATVDALAGRGLVRRVPDPGDRRRKLVTITGDGRKLLTERREAGAENLAAAITSRLTGTERAHLARAIPLMRRLLS